MDSAALRRGVLIIEPEPLLNWSLKTYLSPDFVVRAVSTAAEAMEAIASGFGAVVVSAEIGDEAGALLRAAALRDPNSVLIRLVAGPEPPSPVPGAITLEKPFRLSALRSLLDARLPRISMGATG